MSMRSHYDPIHDNDAPQRVNISSLLAASDSLSQPNSTPTPIATPFHDDDDEEMEEVNIDSVISGSDTEEESSKPEFKPMILPLTSNNSAISPSKAPVLNQEPSAAEFLAVDKTKTPPISASPYPKRTNQTLIISAKQHHIKKKDGEPLWRKDIQFDFLKEVFYEPTKAFTNPFQSDVNHPDHKVTFADLYIQTMAFSSKTSKVLRERLLTDKTMSIPVCMVSLLVNVGRMNTTVNFVPDMKSQLRTFHSIPALQQGKDASSKILQDSPRLKSMLKCWSEAKSHPTKFKDLFAEPESKFPKTNIINMIFMLCAYEHLVIQHFSTSSIENGTSKSFVYEQSHLWNDDLTNSAQSPFNCIFLNFNSTPKSRAKRFLWILYNYLETNLTKEEILGNPFRVADGSLEIPPLEPVPEGVEYDVDTPEEIEYGERMLSNRRKIIGSELKPAYMREYKKLSPETSSETKKRRRDADEWIVKAHNDFKQVFKKTRHDAGNIKYFVHLDTPESQETGVGNYNGDYGEFTSTCTKMFKHVQSLYGNSVATESNKVKTEFSFDPNGRLTGFTMDV